MPVPCFLLFLVSEILHRKYSRNWKIQKRKFLFLPCQHERPKRSRRRSPGGAHLPQARPSPWPRLAWVWGPPGPTSFALPHIYSPRRVKPYAKKRNPRNTPTPPPSPKPSRGVLQQIPALCRRRRFVTGGHLHHHGRLRSDV